MKLHLPKRLFTALLTAITLAAAPAALTLGSAVWGLSVSYEKSFSTTGGTGTVTFGDMTYDYSTGTLTLAGDPTVSTTIDFSMLYTWNVGSDVVFLQNNAGSVSGLVAKTDGTIKGKAAGDNNFGTAKDKSLLSEAYEKSGNSDNSIRVTSTISQSSGVTLTACDTGEELYRASNLKYDGQSWTSLKFDSRIVTNVYYSVAEGTEGANTVITSSDGKWKKSYATVVFNNANTTAGATVLNAGSLAVEYGSDALTNLSSDIIVGGSGQLELNTWKGDNSARDLDINISDKKLYLESSTQNNGALNLGVYCGDITLGDIQLIGNTKITKESSNAGSQVIFAGDVYGNYALTLAPERDSDRFDGVVFTGDVDVKKINVATRAEIAFLGTTNIGEFVTNGDAAFTIGQDAEHTAKMTLGRLEMGNNAGTTGADSLTIHTGSLLKITGSNNTATSENHYKSVSLLIGEWNDETVLNIYGSLLAKEATLFTGNQGGSINIGTAGTVAIKGIATISGRASSVLNLTLADGGKLILGSEGLNSNNVNTDIRFGAGVVGMYADATTIGTAITLQSTSGTTFDTAKYTFADDGDSISQLEGAAGGTMTISGVVSGAGKLIKAGAGTLKLSAENTYSGGTEIAGGTLELTDAGTLGTAAAAVINSGAKLQFSGATDKTITQNLTGGGEIAKQGSGRVTLTGTVGSADTAISTLTLSGGTLELQNSSYITSIQTSGGANLTFSGENVEHTVHGDLGTTGSTGTITIDAGTTLNVNGSLYSTWGMSGGIVANGTLNANVLRLTYDQSEQSVSGTGSVVANQFITGNHGTYRVSVSELTVGAGGFSVGYDGRKAQVYLSSENATINGAVTIAADSKLEVSGGSTTINKNVSGVGALAISGGSLTLNGERNSINSFTYTGGALNYTTLTAGAVNISGESPLSNSGHLTVTGTLAGSIVNTDAGKVTLSNGMSIAAETSASITGDGITEFGGTLTNNGTLTLGGVIALSGDINRHYVVREAAGETGLYVLNYTDTTATNTAGNGFKLTSGGSYWLVQGGTTNLLDGITSLEGYTITQVTDANKTEDERVGDVYISSENYNVGREFYISSGSVDVGTDVQAAATGYTLQGGSMIITGGSVSASAITCDSDAYTDGITTGIITVGAGSSLLLDTMPGGASLLNLLKGEGMVNANSAGRLVVTTAQSLGGAPVTTYKGKLEIVGARLSIGSGQGDTNKLSSLSEIILNDGGNIFYNGKDDADTTVMDFQKITVESGTGEFHLEDSGGTGNSNNTIQFGEIAVAAGATMQLTSRWQDSAYYVDKLTGAGEFHAKSATDSGNNKKLTVNNLAGFSGDLVFTNAGAGFAAVTVNTGSSKVNFHSLSVNDVQGFTFNVQEDTTVGSLSFTGGSNTITVDTGKTLKVTDTLSALTAGSVTLNDGSYLDLTSFELKKYFEMANAAVTGAGTVKYASKSGIVTNDDTNRFSTGATGLTLNNAIEIDGDVAINSWVQDSEAIVTSTLNNNLTVNGELRLENRAKLNVVGGSTLSATTINLGHAIAKNHGHLQISGGEVITGKLGKTTASDTGNTLTMSGGSLEITSDAGVASGIQTVITGGTLKASGDVSWGITGASIGGATIETGTGAVTLHGGTLTGLLTNDNGSLVLSGAFDVTSAGYATTTEAQDIRSNGFASSTTTYTLVSSASNLEVGDDVSWTIDGAAASGNDTLSYAGGSLLHTVEGTEYYVLNTTTLKGISKTNSKGEALTAVVLNGGGLNMNDALGAGVTLKVQEPGTTVVDIAAGQTLNVSQVENTKDTRIALHGSGTLNFGAVEKAYTTSGGHKYINGNGEANRFFDASKPDWTGTVVINGARFGTGEMNLCLNLNLLGNAGSKVELINTAGWFSNNSALNTSLILSQDENNAELAAWTITNGSSSGYVNDAKIMATFAGAVSGDGTMKFGWSQDKNATTGFKFTGDVSGWTGWFDMATTYNTNYFNLQFEGNANNIAVNVKETPYDEQGNSGHVHVRIDDEGSTAVDKTINVGGQIDASYMTLGKSTDTAENRATVKLNNTVDLSATLTNYANTTVATGKTLTAGTVTNSGQIKLGDAATVTGGSMSKVQMSSTEGISGTAQDGSSSMSNADIEVLAQDATFTIADMTLTNTSITAASVNFSNSKVSGNVVLNVIKPTADITAPNVGQGGTDGAISFSYGLALVDSSSTLTLNMEVPQAILPSQSGLYNLTITLNGFAEDFNFSNIANQVVFGADSWLGKALQGATPVVTVNGSTLGDGAAAAQSASGAPSVSYAATGGNVGSLVITITGLNVPEPTTATLSLLALAALAGRRRRK